MVSKSSYKRGKGDIQKKKLKKEEVFKVVKKIGERYLSFLSCSHWLKLFLLDRSFFNKFCFPKHFSVSFTLSSLLMQSSSQYLISLRFTGSSDVSV